jgi:hypothetical protein
VPLRKSRAEKLISTVRRAKDEKRAQLEAAQFLFTDLIRVAKHQPPSGKPYEVGVGAVGHVRGCVQPVKGGRGAKGGGSCVFSGGEGCTCLNGCLPPCRTPLAVSPTT